MRIDIGANSLRTDLNINKTSSDANELKNRGEHVKGKVLDVNQNTVLISSAGKEFLATSTVPMENFIGEEMLFNIFINDDGSILLKPDIQKKDINLVKELKLEDLLNNLKQPINNENKEILKEMIKAGIQVTKESFKEIKDLNISLKLIKEEDFSLISKDKMKIPIDQLVKQSPEKDIKIAGQIENNMKNVSLKEILFLKSANVTVNAENLKALSEIYKSINEKNVDVIGLEKLQMQGENLKGSSQSIEIAKDLINKELIGTNEKETLNKLEMLNKPEVLDIKNPSIKNLDVAKALISKGNLNESQSLEKLLDSIKSISVKKIAPESGKSEKEIIKLDYEKIENNLKVLLEASKDRKDIRDAIEKDILPKTELLKNFARDISFHLIPFEFKKYENIAQYHVKKNKKKSLDDEVKIVFSIDTYNNGNVRALLNYKNESTMDIDMFLENKNIEAKFKKLIPKLEIAIKNLGYKNINLNTQIKTDHIGTIIEEASYKNIDTETFETWV